MTLWESDKSEEDTFQYINIGLEEFTIQKAPYSRSFIK